MNGPHHKSTKITECIPTIALAGGSAIEIPLTPSMTLTVEVDPATGRIVRSTGKATGVEFSTSYSDFRVDSAGNIKTGANQIATIEATRSK